MDTEIVFAFAGTNHAIQAENILLSAGLPVRVMPLPSAIKAGCGICLRLSLPYSAKAKEELNKHDIPVQTTFYRTEKNGISHYTLSNGED